MNSQWLAGLNIWIFILRNCTQSKNIADICNSAVKRRCPTCPISAKHNTYIIQNTIHLSESNCNTILPKKQKILHPQLKWNVQNTIHPELSESSIAMTVSKTKYIYISLLLIIACPLITKDIRHEKLWHQNLELSAVGGSSSQHRYPLFWGIRLNSSLEFC